MRVVMFDKVVGDNHFVVVAEFEHNEDFNRLLITFAPHARMRYKLLSRIYVDPREEKVVSEGGVR